MDRRNFLKASGVAIALPSLEAFANAKKAEKVRRFVGFAGPLGVYPPGFFPTGKGKNFKFNDSTKPLEAIRDDVTVFKNLDHGLTGGHAAIHTLFSGSKLQTAKSNPILYPEKNISLDQKYADNVGHKTRFHSLAVCPSQKNKIGLGNNTCWTKNGIAVPNIEDPQLLFDKLFKQDSQELIKSKLRRADIRSSVLDAVMSQAKSMNKKIGKADQEKMDQYFTSIRGLEKKITSKKSWYDKDKPKVDKMGFEAETHDKFFPIYFDLLHLALVTDSTRSAVFHVPFGFDLTGIGVASRGYHGCSHHGKNPGAVEDLKKVDTFLMKQLTRFVKKLKESNILDDTVVVFGSGMSDGSPHSNKCLPIIVAGGGFNHGEHRIYSEDPNKKTPLCNLYVTILQSLGIEEERFGNSTGTISGFHTV
ncbi:MAG: DUF1552 domain-containing protein [Lentisphaeraceae bacterium]|nr:DUF1552 domain-containing protein [Lentisphaeraceae bacterium]